MPLPTPHLDRARELVDDLQAPLRLQEYRNAYPLQHRELVAQVALAESLLAIAEALHGVVYVANAGSV